MIRKILFSMFLISAVFTSANAQCTADTSLKTPGFSPVALPPASVNVAYSQPISVLVFRDTFITIGPSKIAVKIDSIKATKMIGLPQGFDYTCVHPRCVFVWNEVRCVNIFGTTSQSGLFPILIPVVAYGKIAGSTPVTRPDTLRNFAIQVNGGTNKIVTLKKNGLSVFPNPSSGNVTVVLSNKNMGNTVTIYDAAGRVCSTHPFGAAEQIQIDSSPLPSGTYVVQVGEFYSHFIVTH